MKLLLDCDDVFDRLTRGPFPSGAADDGAVESHLCACHECRELAEALRPAVKLMHEAYVDVSERDADLPRYQGTLPSPACSPARQPARAPWSAGWQLIAASLIGVAVGSLAATGWFSNKENSPTITSASGPQATGLAMLASLQLHDVCLPSSMALASSERLRCCTDCHSSSAAEKKNVDVARLQLACVACHEPRHE
jgi:hypothetical protein